MKHGSLFSGIGGFDLASQWAGFKNIWQVEKDPFCQKVLEKNFPKVRRYDDITKTTGLETVDIISGGFPCQPFSVAGNQKGKEDDRYLWPEMLRIIKEIKPTWIVGENVTGIVNMGLDEVLFNLEDEGYTTETFIIPAISINAPHRRDRIWIIAHSACINIRTQKDNSKEQQKSNKEQYKKKLFNKSSGQNKIITRSFGEWDKNWYEVATGLCRVDDGISKELDKNKRLKALGNAIVPQIAYIIFEAIKEINNKRREV